MTKHYCKLDLKKIVDRALAKAPDDCWLWPNRNKNDARDYGRITIDGRVTKAHRHIWSLYNGPIPSGAMICHHCDTPGCVNPHHLYLGDHKTNMRDKALRERMVRVTNKQVKEARALREKGWMHKDIAKKFKMSISWSVRVCKGERRQFV